MREIELHFLAASDVEQIRKQITAFTDDVPGKTPEELIEGLNNLLPIQKLDVDSTRRRVEGYYFGAEFLWQKILALKDVGRQQIVRMAGLKPLSHYHYLIGSREPKNIVLTRDDFFNDPATALVKLRDDILGLSRLHLRFKAEAEAAG